ncbi:O-antigen polymerase [Biostraticola tofi]|uniref:Oligosaccharide repeat unit polymerase n=1 Tax=Biostraticola tofi TaxID=466109 RepID=A0A4R3Z7M2_9GAMM|nr:O-antigen polymerase [Biostraticola tofi]TCW00211.1 hypothetical protein EDC52_101559 [Biostraticola tofi]
MVELSTILLISITIISFSYLMCRNTIGIFYVQWVIYIVWFFSFPSYLEYINNIYPWPFFPKSQEIVSVNLITALFCMTLFVGYIFGYKRLITAKQIAIKNVRIDLKTNIVSLLLLMPAIIFIGITGIGSFFMGRSFVGEIMDTNSFLPMVYALSKFTAFGVFVVYFCFWINRDKNRKFGTIALVVFFIVISINFIINNPLSSPRFHFLSMAIVIATIIGKMISRKSYLALFVLSPTLLYVLFPLTKHLGEDSGKYRTYELAQYIVQGVDFDSFQQLVNILRYVNDVGYSWGMNFLGGVSFFVPRSLWTDKPTNLGVLSAEHMGYVYTNLSAPLVGEFYYTADLVGVIIGGFVTGLLAGKADSFLRAGNISYYYFVGMWLAAFSFIIFRGSFGAVAPMIILGMMSSLIVYSVSRIRIKI